MAKIFGALLLVVSSVNGAEFSARKPELCLKVTCDTVATHTCFWHQRHYSGAQNTLGMAFGGVGTGKNLNAGADTCAGNIYGHNDNHCFGEVNYRGSNTKGVGCVGKEHRSMRVHHHNKEVNCATKFVTTGQERTNGAVCGIGLVTGKAGCECRPKCGPLYHYVDGTCRLKSANYASDTSICKCSNGTPRSVGCYSHADSCQACNTGYGLHRVSTLTSTGWECTKLVGVAQGTTRGDRQIAGASPCTSDSEYHSSADTCTKCGSTSHTTGGTIGHRTGCSACPAGKVCDGTSVMSACPKGFSCNNGVATKCGTGQYANGGASACVTCAAGEYIASTSGRSYCAGCEAGHACLNGAKRACEKGTYAGPGAADCFTCETGTYASQGAAPRCVPCAAGSYTSDGKTCEACPAGSYCPAKSTSPITCPDGRWSGARATGCLECAAGVIVNKNRCDACPANKVCTDGSASSCQAGQRVESNKCVSCPKGQWAPEPQSSCRPCSTGEGPFCSQCNRNEYIEGHACTACPAGHTCNGITKAACAPGSVSQNGSACKVCSAPMYASNDACAKCPTGSYIRNNKCVQCPAGAACDGSSRVWCAAGSYAAAGQERCSLCNGDDKYSGAGAASCATCPVRKYTSGGTAGKGHTQCLSCIYNPHGSASNIGYVCDGTSKLTKCAASHKAEVVGVCHATAGNQAAPGPGHHGGGECKDKMSQAACSSPGGFTGCTWAEQTIHVIHYTSPLCVPEIRTTDITTETGCPVCSIKGSKFVTVASTTSSWTDPGVSCTGGVVEEVSEELPKNDDGSLKAGRHVLQYYARSQSGKFSYGCGNQNTWTRIVTVNPFKYKTEPPPPSYTAAP